VIPSAIASAYGSLQTTFATATTSLIDTALLPVIPTVLGILGFLLVARLVFHWIRRLGGFAR